MAQYRLTYQVSRKHIEAWAANPSRQCVHATHTCWWSLWDDAWMPYTLMSSRLPCDPRGSVLMQSDFGKFWQTALANPSHYGPYGIDALVAAFHSNVEVLTCRGWRITSLSSWDDYNNLLASEDRAAP